MKNILDQVASLENLYWAWEKARYHFRTGNIWFDQIEVAKFEANLDTNLLLIRQQILSGNYKMLPIRPVAFPKSRDHDGPRTRQTFWISVRDQIAWLATVNIVGPYLEYEMPFWSFGNRLYVSVFPEVDDQLDRKIRWKFGRYRHTSKHIYRKWKQSWPFYRRSISITARKMAKHKIEDDKEKEMLDTNNDLPSHLKIQYFNDTYWSSKLSGDVYWAGIDFKKFYPSIKLRLILDNFNNHYPFDESGHNKNELQDLLKNLLKFPLDTKEWDSKELSDIGLNEKNNYFNGIPTGLFVDGFLANVALLDIDIKIKNKLQKNKNIAHFRFVDDHIIISSSYDQLLNWIAKYRKLIETEKSGITFNKDKIEPKSLGKFIGIWEESGYLNITEAKFQSYKKGSLFKLYRNTKKDVKLDSHFLSPLLTHTLEKVSQIAQIDFDLLDTEEEDKLILDVEHLLVTDFPDQELRKDTRVSFAASILSRIAPRKCMDITAIYNIESNIYKLHEKLKDNRKEIKHTKVNSSKYKKLTKMIVDLQKEIDSKEYDKKQEQKKINNHDEILRNRIKKLFIKAIEGNPEKVKIWARAFEYFTKAGEDDFIDIFVLIEELKQDEALSKLSIEFIYTYILQVLTDQLFVTYNTINNPKASYVQKERATRFFRGVIKSKVLERFSLDHDKDAKEYYKKSVDLFKFTLGSICYLILNETREQKDIDGVLSQRKYKQLCNKYSLINWDDPLEFILDTTYSVGQWTWWITQKITDKLSNHPTLLWNKAVDLIKLRRASDWSLIALYPKALPLRILRIINRNKMNMYLKQEGWLYDIYIGMVQNQYDESFSYLNKIYSIRQHDEDSKYMSLYEWVIWANKKTIETSENDIFKFGPFDPRIAEWTALEIVKQIATLINDKTHTIVLRDFRDKKKLRKASKSPYYKIHPSNYLIPRKWTLDYEKLSWDAWKSIIQKAKIKLRRNSNELIYDQRYTPSILSPLDDETNVMLSLVNGLGVLLLGLLIKNYDLPPFWNPIGFQRMWISNARRKLNECSISSKTNQIISSCFSKRNIETRILDITQRKLKYDEDTSFDPPEILTIDDLIYKLNKSQDTLKQYQLTVQEHQPRQVIPVSFIQMTRDYDPYEELINQGNN